MFNKRILALRRKQAFWGTALLLFALVLARSEVPHLVDEVEIHAPWPDAIATAVATLIEVIGMLVSARQYGRTVDEIERLKG